MRASDDPAYNVWKKMRQRCTNPKSHNYQWYGGKGVTVCARWSVFKNFKEDMGDRPSREHSIDRIDPNKGYTPGNCRWATMLEQNRNRSTNIYVEKSGETLCLAEWASRLGTDKSTIYRRLKNGWSLEDAITRPITEKLHNRLVSPLKQGPYGASSGQPISSS
jgi:hypothetical protein